MKTIFVHSEATADSTGACPSRAAVSDLRPGSTGAVARPSAVAYSPAAGSRSAKRLAKHGMTRINAIGWPLGPQDRTSG